jgi:hypothetical protein
MMSRSSADGRSANLSSINLNIRALMPRECAGCVPLLRAKEKTLCLAKLLAAVPLISALKLPPWLEAARPEVEQLLPAVELPKLAGGEADAAD